MGKRHQQRLSGQIDRKELLETGSEKGNKKYDSRCTGREASEYLLRTRDKVRTRAKEASEVGSKMFTMFGIRRTAKRRHVV